MSIEARAMQYGQLFGGWRIRNFIGEGSGGKTGVFRIVRNFGDFREENALKVVNVGKEDGWEEDLTVEARREFEAQRAEKCAKAVNEVKLMGLLAGSPYVVPYLNWGFFDWHEPEQFGCDLLIQMPLLKTLDRLQRMEKFSEAEIFRVGRDICRALVSCGERNVIHRDIKPANIFIRPDRKGGYMLGDFGISRIVENSRGSAGTKVGTPDYAAPEQYHPGYDSRVDIYSLGLTLYTLANGNRLPFQEPGRGSSGKIIRQRLSGLALPPPGQASPALAQIILKACAFRPEDRYQTPAEFLAALERGRPETEPQPRQSPPQKGTVPEPNHWKIPLRELSCRAQLGDAFSQYGLGMRYYAGIGVPKSHEVALAWFRLAAAQGNAHAMAYIGICYRYGLGVERSLQEAFEWNRRAAEHGDPDAMRALGCDYLRGKTVPQNLEAAVQWLRRSVDLGSTESMVVLAQCCLDGLGVEKDLEEAGRLLQRAADQGNSEAIKRLGAFKSAAGRTGGTG